MIEYQIIYVLHNGTYPYEGTPLGFTRQNQAFYIDLLLEDCTESILLGSSNNFLLVILLTVGSCSYTVAWLKGLIYGCIYQPVFMQYCKPFFLFLLLFITHRNLASCPIDSNLLLIVARPLNLSSLTDIFLPRQCTCTYHNKL